MYLFTKNTGEILVYEMLPNSSKIKSFRKALLQDNPLEAKTLISNNADTLKYLENAEILRHSDLVFDNQGLMDRGHYAYFTKEEGNLASLVSALINGKFDFNPLIKVINDDLRATCPYYYLLLTENYREINNLKPEYQLANILILSEPLYLLQLLIQGKFPRVINADITPFLKLFTFTYVKKIAFLDVVDIMHLGLLKGNLTTLEATLEMGSQILKRARVR